MKLVESSNMNLRLGGADILLRNSTGSRAMQARKQQQMRAAASLRSLGLTHPTPMIELVWGAHSNSLRLKMECLNLTGSLHDRTALSCIAEAEKAGAIQPGASRLIEASFGSSGIAMAMAASMQGYRIRLVLPRDVPQESAAAMVAYGAEIIRVEAGIEAARGLAEAMESKGDGVFLDAYSIPNNPLAHMRGTGPEIWAQTQGQVTHVVAPLSSAGTCMGVSAYLKARNPDVQIIGLQPEDSALVGMRKWSMDEKPPLFQASRCDRIMLVSQDEVERTARVLSRTQGLLLGTNSGGAVSAALRLSAEMQGAVIVAILPDRGERYLESGIFTQEAAKRDPKPVGSSGFWSALYCLVAPRAFPAPHFVLFIASEDPATGRPWCPECEHVTNRVRNAVAKGRGTLLEVHVGSEAEWLNPSHPLRTHPSLCLRYLPTLMEWGANGAGPKRRAAGEWDALQGLIHYAQDAALDALRRGTPPAICFPLLLHRAAGEWDALQGLIHLAQDAVGRASGSSRSSSSGSTGSSKNKGPRPAPPPSPPPHSTSSSTFQPHRLPIPPSPWSSSPD